MSKIHLPIAELKPAHIGLGKVVSKRSTLPVLGHIKVERTKDGWVLLTATNLDVFVSVRLEQPADGEPETMLVSHGNLNRITKSCSPGDIITLDQTAKEKGSITYPIGGQSATSVLDTLAVEEFPAIPQVKAQAVNIPDGVRASIHAALECCSDDETRVILNGAYLDVSNAKEGHHVVGTDGRHLYAANSFKVELPQSVIIPDHAFLRWKEFNRDGEWRMKVGAPQKDAPGFVQISSRRWRFIHRAIEENYPNWRQVCINPNEVKTTVQLVEENLESIAQLISRLPEAPNDNHHTMGFKVVDRRLFVLGRSEFTQPWMEVEINGVKVIGPAITIYLNRQYILKALRFGLNKIEFQEPLSPVRFSKEGQQMVVMPVRTDMPAKTENASQVPSGPSKPVSETSTTERKDEMPRTPAAAVTNVNHSNGHATNGINGHQTNGTAANGNGHEPQEEKPALEVAVEQIEAAKLSLRSVKDNLNTLLETLKQAQRDQKTTSKEVQSVRMTLERLQSVRI